MTAKVFELKTNDNRHTHFRNGEMVGKRLLPAHSFSNRTFLKGFVAALNEKALNDLQSVLAIELMYRSKPIGRALTKGAHKKPIHALLGYDH